MNKLTDYPSTENPTKFYEPMRYKRDLSRYLNRITIGDCISVMKRFPNDSIDCIVTDPPYGISFMGKKWDQALPPKEAFQEMYRVLKPGALAFVMSSPRQDVMWRMLSMLEECGFELRQSFVSWIYKTGFPKAYDVSLGIDRKFIREEFIKKHNRKPTKKEMKKLVEEKRKVVATGKGTSWKFQNKINVEQNFRPSDYYEEKGSEFSITEPYHPSAKTWSGYKSITGLKPALECILMVNKPLSERTIVDNVLKHGVGAINVDACRISYVSEDDKEGARFGHQTWKSEDYHFKPHHLQRETKNVLSSNQGRFPANLLCSDKALDTGEITKSPSGKANRQPNKGKTWNPKTCGLRSNPTQDAGYGDIGDQSRYFDLDAWVEHHGFLDVPKASKSERNKGLEKDKTKEKTDTFSKSNHEHKEFIDRLHGQKKRFNYHPTVKPIKLMAYLIELGCPKDGIVLDPFVGSGTTCIASKQLNRNYIGIERNHEYVLIARKRIVGHDDK